MNWKIRQPIACLRPALIAFALASSLALVACEQPESSGQIVLAGNQTSVSFQPPMQLQSRQIVRQNLILRITLNGQVTVVEPNEDGQYIYRTAVPARTSTAVFLEWSELIDGRELTLATASKSLNVGTDTSEVVLDFFSSEYDTTTPDDDDDGYSNLVERRQGSFFDDATSPDAPPVPVMLEVRLVLPVALRDASDDIKSRVDARATVNGEDLPLTREGSIWRGTRTVTQNSEPLVRADFFATTERRTEIATLSRNDGVGDGATIVFNEGDYDTETFNYDGDALSNAQETANDTNPRDSSDPPDDRDNDGVPDFQDNCPDSSNADQQDDDNDGRGNACDDINDDDRDGDGIENSRDNCPDNSNPGQEDVDSDGLGNACDLSNALDPDADGIVGDADNCPDDANSTQIDSDNDGLGDVCDLVNDDRDGDRRNNDQDNCPDIANADQTDSDNDGVGDACDLINDDRDGDGRYNDQDNCPDTPNPDQADEDRNSVGDACDVLVLNDSELVPGAGSDADDDADDCPDSGDPEATTTGETVPGSDDLDDACEVDIEDES